MGGTHRDYLRKEKKKNSGILSHATTVAYTILSRILIMCKVYRGVGWGVDGKQVGSIDEEPQVRGCYNITFICTPTNQETVSVLEKTQANKTFRT